MSEADGTVAASALHERFQRLLRGQRPIVASHRGPVTFQDGPSGCTVQPGAGGLAGALRALSRHVPWSWVACAMTQADRSLARRGQPLNLDGETYRLRLVDLPPRVHQLHYEVFSNPLLWFVQHGLAEQLQTRDEAAILEAWSDGYLPANARIAEAIAAEAAEPGRAPLVLIHDYQLYLVPALLRRLRQDLIVHHFVHIPWPEPDAWSILPASIRRALLAGLLGADIIGFQTWTDVCCFLACCRAWLGAEVDERDGLVRWRSAATRVRAYPISVDVGGLQRLLSTPRVRADQERLRPLIPERAIVRVDRLDPSKNIPRGFAAFERLLAEHPAWRERVVFLSFLVPSRSSIPEYRALADEVMHQVAAINQRFGSGSWQPIHLFYDHNREQALAGLSLADVVLVNSLADGMNLVAKEAAVVSERDAVLVLSTRAGAFEELWPASIGIDPLDTASTAAALHRALSLPPVERRARASLLRRIVARHDLTRWMVQQLDDLAPLLADRAAEPALPATGARGAEPLARSFVAVR